jgi:transposase
MAYSTDLRQRALAYAKIHGPTAAAKVFNIGRGSLYNWLNNLETRGTLAPCPPPGRQSKLDLEALRQYVEEKPDLYQHEYGEHFGVVKSRICTALKQLNITRKKKRTLLP